MLLKYPSIYYKWCIYIFRWPASITRIQFSLYALFCMNPGSFLLSNQHFCFYAREIQWRDAYQLTLETSSQNDWKKIQLKPLKRSSLLTQERKNRTADHPYRIKNTQLTKIQNIVPEPEDFRPAAYNAKPLKTLQTRTGDKTSYQVFILLYTKSIAYIIRSLLLSSFFFPSGCHILYNVIYWHG
jgi:hypothetical protein